MLERATFSLLVVGALVTLGFMLGAGEPVKPLWWVGFLPFGIWALVPYGALAWFTRRCRVSRSSQWVLLVAALLLSGVSSALLYQAFAVELDPQSGIVFVFLPVWQLLGLSPGLFVAWTLRSRGSIT
jgi:hypothetical protein